MNQNEIWKKLPSKYGVYEVSNLGRVKSLKRGGERILKQMRDTNGYPMVALYGDIRKNFSVHKLVAMMFLDHSPCGMSEIIDHIDNDRLNNNVSNLQITNNRHNCSKDAGGTSKYTGVSWSNERKKWQCGININGKRKSLGRFKCEYEAHLAYQDALNNLQLFA